MKKTAISLILALVLICLSACGTAVKIGGFSSLYFNGDDFDEAVNQLMIDFKRFEGCTLQEVNYAGDKTVKAEADARNYPVEHIMVLEITFTTDGEERANAFEPNQTYEHYTWTYARDFVGGPWYELDHGYC